MTLTQDKRDLLLIAFAQQHNAEHFINGATTRGDIFESAITGEACKRNGLHEISKGDYTYNGMAVEIKYLTKKTKASKELKGTIATHYLIGFNTGKEIEIRLIPHNEIIYTNDSGKLKISYQANINKGVRVEL